MPTKASTSSAHTPGPWFLEPVDLVVYDNDRPAAEAVASIEYRSSVEEREANAWLITAAPLLLGKLTALASAAHWIADNWQSGNLTDATELLEGLKDLAYWADRTIAVAHGAPLPCTECGGEVTDPTDEFCEPCNQRAAC